MVCASSYIILYKLQYSQVLQHYYSCVHYLTISTFIALTSHPQPKQLQCYLEIRPTKTVTTTVTRTTTVLSNVTETDTCIAPTARRSASINSSNIGPKPTITNSARLVNHKSLNKKFGLANLMQFIVTVTTIPPRPTSTPRPRRRPNRRRRGPRPPITVIKLTFLMLPLSDGLSITTADLITPWPSGHSKVSNF